MTSQLNVDTIVDKAGSGGPSLPNTTTIKMGNTSTYVSDGGAVTQNTVQGLAKEWVNFDGTGTVAIRDSTNVSSITDNGTGSYRIVMTTAMGNTDYANCTNTITTIDTTAQAFTITSVNNISTTEINVATRREDNNAPSFSATDSEVNMVSTFGDLA